MSIKNGNPKRRGKAASRPLPTTFHTGLSRTVLDQWEIQRPDVRACSFQLGTLAVRLSILISQLRNTADPGDQDVRNSAMDLLYALRRVGPPYAQRPTDLYRLLGVTSGAVTYTIRILADRGLIEKVADSNDKRSHLIRLTPAGLRLVDTNVTETADILEHACRGLGAEEQDHVRSAMLMLASSWEAYVDALNDPET